jgi:hypothetical protein
VAVPADELGRPIEGWAVEAQCPSCEEWACFTADDTPERERKPTPEEIAEREAEFQRHAAKLFEPIERNRGHPAVRWFEKIGNGMFEDEYGEFVWPVPWTVFRFRRGNLAAYVWEEDGRWHVRTWATLRREPREPAIREARTVEEALDHLTDAAGS